MLSTLKWLSTWAVAPSGTLADSASASGLAMVQSLVDAHTASELVGKVVDTSALPSWEEIEEEESALVVAVVLVSSFELALALVEENLVPELDSCSILTSA